MKALLVMLSLLLATVASAQSISTGYLSGSAQPGFSLELTSSNTAGVYYIGPSAAMTFAEFRLGSALRGTLYNCFAIDADTDSNGAGDGTVDASANCTPILGLSGNGSGAVLGGGRYLHIDIDTAESGTNKSILLIRGSNTLSHMTNEDMCRAGLQGFGYNNTTRRWLMTCADFNWPGWRDSSQMTASYTIDCISEGNPHASCYLSTDTVYKGYWMRLALAAQYTEDGGRVIALDHPYNYDGAGLLQNGVTRAKFPLPFDPEWEAKPEFARLGYPTSLNSVLVNRGVIIEGLGTPDLYTSVAGNSEVSWNTPKLVGSFFVDDYGPTAGSGGPTPILDGPNQNMRSPVQYRTNIGWNRNVTYCHTTSNIDPACNREFHTLNDQFKFPGSNEYGVDAPILSDFTTASSATLCLPDTVGGSSPGTATGVCSGNRMVTCWQSSVATAGRNQSTAAGRNVGGCIFDTDNDGDFTAGDTGNLNLGICDSFHDALQYDRQTLKQDLKLVVTLPNCSDDASSVDHCRSTTDADNPVTLDTFVMGYGSHVYDISTPIGSWTGALTLNGTNCGTGAYVEVGYKGGTVGTYSFGAERQRYYVNTGVSPGMLVRAVREDKVDLKGAGWRNFGFMPSSWYGRNSAALGDCLSGGDISNDNDEPACDVETQLGFAGGYNGVAERNLFVRGGLSGNKSGVIETEAFAGGPNYFRENRILDQIRVNGVSDWGDGVFERNYINGVNIAGTGYPLFFCYSDNCVIQDNVIERVKASRVYGFTAGTTNNLVRRNRYRDISYSYGGAFYDVEASGTTIIEDEQIDGAWGNTAPILHVKVGTMYHKPNVIFRRNRGLVFIQGFANGHPAALAYVENYDGNRTRADTFNSIQITDNVFRADVASRNDSCFFWAEEDTGTDAAAQVQEKWGNILIQNNVYNAPATAAGADIACAGAYRTSGVINDATNDNGPSAYNTWPILLNNIVNGVPALDVPHGWRTVANVPDADTLAEGTKVKVSNGTAACGHTTGVLTAGAVRISCTAHPNGAGDDGTWTAD